LILIHLAKGHLLSEGSSSIVRDLLARQLVIRAPSFKIMSDEFARFILDSPDVEELLKWEGQASRSNWEMMRVPLLTVLIGTAMFLFATQQEIFSLTIALVTAVTAGLPAIIRVIALGQERKYAKDMNR
jgi:hypothetical protein